ncbi:hypothetical protein ACIQUM_30955 [Amycolatopsis azurea]|uniref:hypothetical protein n=1 Tax=Amycolatopsis azurea TaxID=36819 RepID=UPI003822B0D3
MTVMVRRSRRVALAALVAAMVAGCSDGTAIDPAASPEPIPLVGAKGDFAIDTSNPAAAWVGRNQGSPLAATVRDRVVGRPNAHLVKATESGVAADVAPYLDAARDTGKQAILLADADAGAACGTISPVAYSSWGSALGAAVGGRDVIIVLRLGGAACKTARPAGERQRLTDEVVSNLRATAGKVRIILDVSDLAAQEPAMVTRFLETVAVGKLTGIAVNVGLNAGDAEVAAMVSKIQLGHLVALQDSSRSGAGGENSCNRPEARVGPWLTLNPDPGAVQRMWLTTPGVSDGPCGAAPNSTAGEFVPELATLLLDKQRR